MANNEKKTAICLKCAGGIKEFEMDSVDYNQNILSIKSFPKSFVRSKGHGKLKMVHNFKIKNKHIGIYAWNDGEAGWENKHELPPPIENELYFGNVFMIGYNNEKQVSISIDDYKTLNNKYFKGFEDIGSEDSWSDEESLSSTDSLNDFIVPG